MKQPETPTFGQLIRSFACLLRQHVSLWLVPMLVIGSLGTAYALLRPPTWQASQALLIRDEVVGELNADGRFDSTDARKAAQEMVLQVSRNHNVLRRALEDVGPLKDGPRSTARSAPWPSAADVRSLADAISVAAPKGTELGQSDVIRLQVKSRDPRRAGQLAASLCQQLEAYLQRVRSERAASVVQELDQKLSLTEQKLAEALSRLKQMERQVGSDLGELRTLSQVGSGDGNLRSSLNQVERELRAAKRVRLEQHHQLEVLRSAQKDPEAFVATPNRLLEAYPSLRRLKDGLTDAQLRLADLLGRMNAAHPTVKSAMVAVEEIRHKVHRELAAAIEGTTSELQISDAVIADYQRQRTELQQRLTQLAEVRAEYETVAGEVQNRAREADETRNALTQAEASRQASSTASVITYLDAPEVSDRPAGPGRLTLVALAWISGSLTGVGLLLLLTANGNSCDSGSGRRWTDRVREHVGWGRRASDLSAKPLRRAADRSRPLQAEAAATPRRSTDAPSGSPPSVTSPTDTSTRDAHIPASVVGQVDLVNSGMTETDGAPIEMSLLDLPRSGTPLDNPSPGSTG